MRLGTISVGKHNAGSISLNLCSGVKKKEWSRGKVDGPCLWSISCARWQRRRSSPVAIERVIHSLSVVMRVISDCNLLAQCVG